MRNARIQTIFAGWMILFAFCGCGTVTVGPPVFEYHGVPIYQVGSGLTADMSPAEAARVRGQVTMEELRRNEMGDEFNYGGSQSDYVYPPE